MENELPYNDLDFWLRVQEEYKTYINDNQSDTNLFICHACDEFDELWDYNPEFRNEVRNIADRFLAEKEYNDYKGYGNVLFSVDGSYFTMTNTKIRIQFLEWVINNLQK